MSGLLAGKVWQSGLAPHLKPVAAALADIANDDGSRIYPTVAYVAWLLGRSPRAIQDSLSDLRERGILSAVAYPSGGRGHPVEYVLNEDRLPVRPPWRERNDATTAPITATKGAVQDTKPRSSRHERVQSATESTQPASPPVDPSVDPSRSVRDPSGDVSAPTAPPQRPRRTVHRMTDEEADAIVAEFTPAMGAERAAAKVRQLRLPRAGLFAGDQAEWVRATIALDLATERARKRPVSTVATAAEWAAQAAGPYGAFMRPISPEEIARMDAEDAAESLGASP